MGKHKLRHILGLLCWRLYVLLYWNDNKDIQFCLDKQTGENLFYYLNNPNRIEPRHNIPKNTEELW
jgi:hypothetical protein